VAGGSAAAAVSLFGGSAPLSGVIPAQRLLAGWHYDFEVFPLIEAGEAGWCTWVQMWPAGTRLGAASGMGFSGCTGTGLNGAGTALPGSSVTSGASAHAGSFAWLLLRPGVAAVRLTDGKTVGTLPDPRLPSGYRAAVINQGAAAATALDRRGKPIAATAAAATQPDAYWVHPARAPTRRAHDLGCDRIWPSAAVGQGADRDPAEPVAAREHVAVVREHVAAPPLRAVLHGLPALRLATRHAPARAAGP
jgi:hypothetical protein